MPLLLALWMWGASATASVTAPSENEGSGTGAPQLEALMAPGPPDYSNLDPDWEEVDRVALQVYTAGWITGLVGLGITTLSLGSPDSRLGGFGNLVVVAGAPIMAGAALRSSRALAEQGLDPGDRPGYLAWGLWLGGLVAQASWLQTDPGPGLELAGVVVCFGGAYYAATVQARVNQIEREDLALSLMRGWRLRPSVSPNGVGLVLSHP